MKGNKNPTGKRILEMHLLYLTNYLKINKKIRWYHQCCYNKGFNIYNCSLKISNEKKNIYIHIYHQELIKG